MLKKLRVFAAGLAIASLVACQQVENPATGETELSTVSLEQEREMGREAHPQILAQFGGEYQDPELQGYVRQIGMRLARGAELPAEQFTFTLLDTPVVNAFAVPGGYVYVTRGMLAILNTEAELAGVMGHEIGHVTARHSAQQQKQGLFANLAVLGAAILTGSGDVARIGQVAAQGYMASHSRSDERQADSLGIRYLSRAGYDPMAMAGGLRALQRHSELIAAMSGRELQQVSFFSTHPHTPERVAATADEARGVSVSDPEVGRDAYLDAIDGMIYGDSPSQGFARGNTFAHPELRFSFQVPEGFSLDNLPQAVVASSRDGGRRIIFDQEPDRSVASRQGGMDAYIANHWGEGAQLSGLKRITLDGMPAATAVAPVTANNQPYAARLVAIRFDENRIYRFVFLAPRNDGRALSSMYERTVGSFERLTASEARQLQPLRLQVVTVDSNDTVSSLSSSAGAEGFAEQRFRVLNDLGGEDGLRPGRRVKVVRVGG
ncbi:M48 family metalloprotease [Minwuia thermotolerans]|uniref:Peptidase M48 domain-containing protein n=1 Tax=Minwuia thermotolerans TaxID=2056226 RepID=A0A2M9FYX6_9PROT|nr:M48 family metalloprotease [Minwuia thermotolerans]PJK28665.1 hypothetical protein CVT23_15075 [Minwuia thermotolerans]